MARNQIEKARDNGAVAKKGAGASILESLNAEFTRASPVTAETDSLLIDCASALCGGYYTDQI